jgi:diketogulonate reductase-like aldo/keto reductase
MEQTKAIATRIIPASGEKIGVIGLGTWQTFDVAHDADLSQLKEVLKVLVGHGGNVIDSSPMYGRSEEIAGTLSAETKLNDNLFIATKVWTNGKEDGIRQMNKSMSMLRRKSIDLMQVHNLTDWKTHLETLRDWKTRGLVRYIGITHYTESAYPLVESILRDHEMDFLQINYSVQSRKAEERLLPLAQDRKVAVLINRPFEEGALFSKVKGKRVPEWAVDVGCETWGQLFLKFILAHPAVTCVIPGTSKPHHMLDNLHAGRGALPDESIRQKIVDLFSK